MSDQAYLQMFVEEGREHVQRMNTLLLEVESSPENIEPIQELFRSAHTLKGMAATMGFEGMADLTHELENLLQQRREGQLELTGEMMDLLFQGVDHLERMVEQAAAGEDLDDVGELLTRLRGDVPEIAKAPEVTLSFDAYERNVIETSWNNGYEVYRVQVTLTEGCQLKGVRAYMVYDALQKQGEIIKSVPSIEDLEEEKFERTFQLVLITQEHIAGVEQSLTHISQLEDVSITSLSADDLRVSSQVTPNSGEPTQKTGRTPVEVGKLGQTIRVDIGRLDTLMNLFSEWVIDRGRLEQLASEIKRPELIEVVEHMSRVGGDLQDTILKMRMVPVEQVFNRFPRMIRDLAKDLNKRVKLEISGAETELDRTVIDEIGDPLVHLLRNALDHGLEKPEERRQKGKPDTGLVSLKAYHSGNHVFIEIADDGAGINREAVIKKAIDKGIVNEEAVASWPDSQVYDLLFDSGFSTSEQVTDVSGRGVGLDVVRTKIESLGGYVSVDSEKDKGTMFIIQLPLTLSILTSLLVRVGPEKYAIPLNSILETGKFSQKEVENVHGQPVLRFRERIVPLLSLKDVFAVPEQQDEPQQDMFVVIVQKGDELTGFIVDEFLGQQEVVLKSLGTYLQHVFAVSGATILGDGQVALIVDAHALMQQSEEAIAI